MAKYKTIKPKKKGQKPIKFRPGGLHRSTGTPAGVPIPKGKYQKAMGGGYGKLAAKQARFKKNVLTGRKKSK